MKIFIKRLIMMILWVIDWIIPKDKSILVIGGNSGNGLSGNSLAMYQYAKSQSDFSVYKFVKDHRDPDSIGYKRIKDIWILLRAGNTLSTHGLGDIGGPYHKAFLKRNRKKYFVWHGITIKTLGKMDNSLPVRMQDTISRRLQKFDVHGSTSPLYSYLFSSFYGIDIRKFIVCGYPRNDQLFSQEQPVNTLSKYGIKKEYSKIVLWAPTFRENTTSEFSLLSTEDFRQLNEFCSRNDILVIMRLHRNEKVSVKLSQFSNITLLPFEIEPDINSVLSSIDIVVTDYSSLFIDFLILNRPCIFYVPDIEEYMQQRGIILDYSSMTPGPKVRTINELTVSLNELLHNNDSYNEQRQMVLKLFHTYRDPHSSKRFYTAILQDAGV